MAPNSNQPRSRTASIRQPCDPFHRESPCGKIPAYRATASVRRRVPVTIRKSWKHRSYRMPPKCPKYRNRLRCATWRKIKTKTVPGTRTDRRSSSKVHQRRPACKRLCDCPMGRMCRCRERNYKSSNRVAVPNHIIRSENG